MDHNKLVSVVLTMMFIEIMTNMMTLVAVGMIEMIMKVMMSSVRFRHNPCNHVNPL